MLAAVATLVAMVCMPAPAFAQPPPGTNITIISAGATNGNPYQLTVEVNDANGIPLSSPDGGTTPAMTVHILSSSNDVYDVTTMAYVSGPANDQIWTQPDQIPQANLPAGTYTLSVDMYDALESDLGVQAPFSFSYTTTLTVMANPPTVTAGSQDVTFTGSVTGVATGGTPVGIANAPVLLSISSGTASQVTTTDANGNFSYPISGISQTADYNFSVNADAGGTYSAANDDITVNAQQATTAIQVTPSPASVSEGSPGVTFNGSVTVTPQGTTTATGIGSGVEVDVSINGGTASPAATTDANGNFSYQAQPISASTTYTFSVASTPLYSSASSPLTIPVTQAPSAITVTPSPAFVTLGSQDVTFNGTVTALPGGNAVPIPNAQVYVNGGQNPVATTDSNGKFSYQVTGITQTTGYTFSINQTNLYSAATYLVTIPLNPAHTEMTAIANPPDVNLGSSTVTFSGTVTVTPAGSTNVVGIGSGVPVYLSINGGTPTQVTATDDANGDFTDTITGITQAADYNFSVNAGPSYSSATADVPIGLQQLAANLVVTPSQVSVTEGSQNVTFAGVLTGTAPGSTVVVSIPNAPVYLNGGTTPIATTDSAGKFSYQIKGIGKASSFTFSVTGAPTTYSNATDDVPIGVTAARTRITGITTSPTHLKYGEKAKLTGAVQYRSGTAWIALPGATVHLFEGKTSVGKVVTGKGGSFTATLPTTNGPAWRATLTSAVLLQQASAIGNLSISVPMRVKSFTASLGVLGSIKATGCLQVTVPVRYGPASKIEIQYATSSRGPWIVLGKLQLHNVAGAPALCRDANESYFSGSIRAKLANAYYRANFAGTFSFQRTTSPVIHAWRYQTKITDYKVSPRAVSTGGKVKISGRLWRHGKSWKPYGNRKVDIIYNEKGTSYWAHLGNPLKTSAGGYFSETAVASSGKFVAIIYAVYSGSKTDLAVQSNGVAVAINESSTSSPAPLGPTHTSGRLPVISLPTHPSGRLPIISLPTYRGLAMLAQDALHMAAREIRALAFWPR
jgi:hypothetical protein